MESLVLWSLTIALMFAGGHCTSSSYSCSTVNGQTICENQQSDGNVASSFSSSGTGGGNSYQDVGAMTGNSHSGDSSSSRTQTGNVPSGSGGFGGFPGGFSSGGGFPGGAYAGSGAYAGPMGGGGAYAGPMPAGPFDPFAAVGLPNPMAMLFGRRR